MTHTCPTDRLRVVLLAHYFPPMGGAGTQRFAAFARHLPELGIDPVVVCGAEDRPGACTIARDATLERDLLSSVAVRRVPSVDAGRPGMLDHLSPQRLLYGPAQIAWGRRAIDETVRAAAAHRAQAIVVTVSPYVTGHRIRAIARRTGCPVILDLRDPWALDGWRSFRSRAQVRLDRRSMRRALCAAAVVVANCPAAGDAYARLAGPDAPPIVVIPNGYETADFARRSHPEKDMAESTDAPDARDAPDASNTPAFRIVHVGTWHAPTATASAADRAVRPHACADIEHHGRSGRALLDGAGGLLARAPHLARHLRIDLYGQIHPAHAACIARHGLESIVHDHGYVDHDQAIDILRYADAIHVPLHGMPPGRPALAVPGKLYEALASQRPVLGTLPAGDARRLIETVGGDGVVLDPDDGAGVTEVLAAWIERRLAGDALRGATREVLAPFTRGALTERLAQTIRWAVTSHTRSHPAVAATGPGVRPDLPADDPWDAVGVGHDDERRDADDDDGGASPAAIASPAGKAA